MQEVSRKPKTLEEASETQSDPPLHLSYKNQKDSFLIINHHRSDALLFQQLLILSNALHH